MKQKEKQRPIWVKLYEQTQNAGLTCRRCGISRPTLRKWWRRYQDQGETSLQSLSRRPYSSPMTKADGHIKALILFVVIIKRHFIGKHYFHEIMDSISSRHIV